MISILAIGNSFSTDATYYLHDILEVSGVENRVVNLYIGGCSLERHWQNIEGNKREYQYQLNGRPTDRHVSIEEVLTEEKFDVIVTHQASHDSGWACTYEPFLGLLLDYLKEHSDAKVFLNETWAYETDSWHWNFMRYEKNQEKMFTALKAAYEAAAERHNLPLIRSGEAIQKIRQLPAFASGELKITRDGFHMNFIYGRFAVAMMWAAKIAGIDVLNNPFVPSIDFMKLPEADEKILADIRKIVSEYSKD